MNCMSTEPLTESLETPVCRRLRGMRFAVAASLSLLVLAITPAFGQVSKPELPPPGVLGDVTSATYSTQSYALYLPSTYTPAKRWPIVYFFDPGGHGRRPLELYKNLAETYGFIFAGSNNSRNFAPDESKNVNAIWQDTHTRFALDEHRIYTSGFSGGARAAGAMALSCPACGIAGVAAHGAGYPNNRVAANDKQLYFFAVGDHDFNWQEVVTVRREREDQGLPYRVQVFSGSHQWAPYAVMEDAIQWFVLRAMQSGTLQPDASFIDHRFERIRAESDDAEKRKDPIAQLSAYRALVDDFAGLKDVTEFSKKLVALKSSAAFKAALKEERAQISDQFDLEGEISPKLHAYVQGSAPDLTALRTDIIQSMGRLRDQAEHAKNEGKRLIFSRALDDMRVSGIEDGQQELEARHFEKAELCFELMADVIDDPWPVLLLAETHASEGKKKQAMSDLKKAVQRGLKDADVLDSNERLQILEAEPEFQKLLTELRQKQE